MMISVQRVLAVLVAAMLMVAPSPLSGSLRPAVADPAGPTSAAASPEPAPRVLRFDAGGDRAHTSGSARMTVRRWNTTRITYFESLPAAWDWSLRTAIAKWNTTGADIRFVRVADKRKARLLIGYGNVGSAAGRATIGPASPAWVKLSDAYRKVDALDAFNRVAVMAVLTHELGHVLGYGHTTETCSLMASTLNFDDCGVLPRDRPGYYKCQIIDLPLVRAHVGVYGGTARSAGRWCLIAPLPPRLADLRFIGGGDREVEIAWTPPRSLPAGTRAELRIAPGQCGSPTGAAQTQTLQPGAGMWRDAAAPATGVNCFAVRTVNRYGAGQPWVGATLKRWAILAAPKVEHITWDGHAFVFDAYAPEGVIKFVRDREHPETCPTTVGEHSEYLSWDKRGRAWFEPEAKVTCLALFATDEKDGRRSRLVPVTFDVGDHA